MSNPCDSCGRRSATHRLRHRFGTDYLCPDCAQGVVPFLAPTDALSALAHTTPGGTK